MIPPCGASQSIRQAARSGQLNQPVRTNKQTYCHLKTTEKLYVKQTRFIKTPQIMNHTLVTQSNEHPKSTQRRPGLKELLRKCIKGHPDNPKAKMIHTS